jgi:hypothetical protein
MGLKKSDVLKDPVVQEVIKALEPLGCTAPSEDDLDRPPMLRIMIETDNLDSETAAILVAGKMTRGKFPEDYMPVLREDLTATLWILQDPDNKDNPARIYEQLIEEDGSGPAMKIAMAAVTARGTGPEFEAMKATMNRSELIQHANEIAEVASLLTGHIGENLRWSPMAQPALEAFYASVSTLSEYADSRDAREFRETVRAFKAQAGIKDEPKPATFEPEMRTASIKGAPKPMAMSASPESAPRKPSPDGLQPEDVMDDPLVKKTVEAIESLGLGRHMSTREITGHPAIQLLASMSALDSVSAAVLVAESLAAGSMDPGELAGVVPAEVGDVLRQIGDMEGDGMLGGFESGNPTLTKLAMAGIAEMLTGRDIRELERADPAEKRMAMMQIGTVGFTAIDIAEAARDHGLLATLPAPLVDRFTEGLENLANLSEGKAMKRFFTEAVSQLKADVLKANAKDLTEPKPPEGGAPGTGPAPDAPKGPSSGSFKF